MNENVVASRHI